jgi:hypothetical protein
VPTQLLATQEKRGPRGRGQKFRIRRGSCSSPAANGQPATLQTPQGLDAQHGGELFPIDVRLTSTRLNVGRSGRAPHRCCDTQRRVVS